MDTAIATTTKPANPRTRLLTIARSLEGAVPMSEGLPSGDPKFGANKVLGWAQEIRQIAGRVAWEEERSGG